MKADEYLRGPGEPVPEHSGDSLARPSVVESVAEQSVADVQPPVSDPEPVVVEVTVADGLPLSDEQ